MMYLGNVWSFTLPDIDDVGFTTVYENNECYSWVFDGGFVCLGMYSVVCYDVSF